MSQVHVSSNFLEKYRLSSKVNQAIVDGILQGYKNYLIERREKKQSMHISDAYAWVRGNHIDDQVARECKELNIKFEKAKAGYSWGYLQYKLEDEKRMFIVKSGRYFNKENYLKKNNNESKASYLDTLAKINDKIKFPENLIQEDDDLNQIQVTLFAEEVMRNLDESEEKKLKDEFDAFYIVIFEVDKHHVISKIQLLLPNPSNKRSYVIEDLTELISKSSVTFTNEDYEVLVDDVYAELDPTNAVHYGIVPITETEEEKEG